MQALDGASARRWADLALTALSDNRDAIDQINVYPVPDNDTGTNLWQTMRAAVAAVDDAALRESPASGLDFAAGADTFGLHDPAAVGPPLAEVLAALTKGALAGARGNSGVLLSQVLRGIAEEAQATPLMDGSALCRALLRATERATQAVAVPEEGTLLSVLRAATDAARSVGTGRPLSDGAGTDLASVVRAATMGSIRALNETTAQLAPLSSAGVVDAGGRGLVVVLDALHAVLHDGQTLAADPPPFNPPAGHGGDTVATQRGSAGELADQANWHESRYDYEVMYALSGVGDAAAAALRQILVRIGDCVSVAGDGSGSWAVHVHCDDIGAVIESGIESGKVHSIQVTRFADQVSGAQAAGAEGSTDGPGRGYLREHAVLACARGAELAELFGSEGASVFTVDPAHVPGAEDIVAAIRDTHAAHVLLLPNDEVLTPLAEEAAGLAMGAGREVVIVPTVSPVQGLAALAVHDPNRRTAEDTVALTEAAAATRRGEVVVADSAAITWVGYCQPGDVLAMADGEVVLIGKDLTAATCDLADRMLAAGGELVTALVGSRAPADVADALAARLRLTHPEVELTCYPGGDLASAVLLGVE